MICIDNDAMGAIMSPAGFMLRAQEDTALSARPEETELCFLSGPSQAHFPEL